jgi:hypothetical protein
VQPDVDTWSDSDQRIIVGTPPDGYLFDLQLNSKIDSAPDDVYKILTVPGKIIARKRNGMPCRCRRRFASCRGDKTRAPHADTCRLKQGVPRHQGARWRHKIRVASQLSAVP